MRRRDLVAALLCAATVRLRPAAAQTAELRIARPLDLIALPLIVMQHDHLIERTAEAMGLGTISVRWSEPDKADPIAALAAGDSDFVAADLAPFVLAADAGDEAGIRALGALAQRPYVLVARNPAIRTIRDFRDGDHIAVPALKTSGPAVMLQMAAAQEWGIEHFDKLDRFMVARPDPAAAAALLAGKGDIDAHFSRTPFADDELADEAIHRVMDSFDIAGPHSSAVLATTARFGAVNHVLCEAVLSAIEEAGELIKKSPGAAAEIYAGMIKERDTALEDLTDMIGDPDLAYRAAPAGLMRLANFMHRTGRLRRRPNGWQELFLPAARDLPGN